MSPDNDNLAAFSAVTLWLIGKGFHPPQGFDKDDPFCVRNSGSHRIWTFLTPIVYENFSKTFGPDAISDSLSAYLDGLDTALHMTFHLFGIRIEQLPDNGQALFEISVYI